LEDVWEEDAVEPVRPERKPDHSGEATLDAASAFIARFVHFPSEAALNAATLWAAHSHHTDADGKLAFNTTPRIGFVSDEPASGKTMAMSTMGLLCRKAEVSHDLRALGLATAINEDRVDVLIDEFDGLVGSGNNNSQLRGMVLSGYKRREANWRRGSKPAICIFGAVAFAGLGSKIMSASVLKALRSRTIFVRMVAAEPGDIEEYNPRHHDDLADALRDDLARWALHNATAIASVDPEVPEGIHNRNRELCEPLLQIADIAGGHWPTTARESLRELLLRESDNGPEAPLSTRLLEALRAIFGDQEKLSTVEILTALFEVPGNPWRKLWPSNASAPRELAKMLAPLGVEPIKIRQGEKTMRGYAALDLSPYWEE
jgi:hypothetical protein